VAHLIVRHSVFSDLNGSLPIFVLQIEQLGVGLLGGKREYNVLVRVVYSYVQGGVLLDGINSQEVRLLLDEYARYVHVSFFGSQDQRSGSIVSLLRMDISFMLNEKIYNICIFRLIIDSVMQCSLSIRVCLVNICIQVNDLSHQFDVAFLCCCHQDGLLITELGINGGLVGNQYVEACDVILDVEGGIAALYCGMHSSVEHPFGNLAITCSQIVEYGLEVLIVTLSGRPLNDF